MNVRQILFDRIKKGNNPKSFSIKRLGNLCSSSQRLVPLAFIYLMLCFLPSISYALNIVFFVYHDDQHRMFIYEHKTNTLDKTILTQEQLPYLRKLETQFPGDHVYLDEIYTKLQDLLDPIDNWAKQLGTDKVIEVVIDKHGGLKFIDWDNKKLVNLSPPPPPPPSPEEVIPDVVQLNTSNRSQLTEGAWEQEVGNRWMVRFSSKRPTYRTFADWMAEARMNMARGMGNGRIKLHPTDAERLSKTNEGKLELAKIWEYNERLDAKERLTIARIEKIRGRDIMEYGGSSFNNFLNERQLDAFNDGFSQYINPYEIAWNEQEYALRAYKGEKWLKRMPMGGYYAWFCGILMGAGMVVTVVELITNFVHINLPKDDLFQIFHQDNLSPMLENASPMDKANYLKNNPHAWMLKEQGQRQGFSIHNQCTYSQSNLATNFKR